MHDTVNPSATQGLSQQRTVRAFVFDYRGVLCLEPLKAVSQDILYLDDRAEIVEAAARLGSNSVLFDTVEKTASRIESRFDIPVASYSRSRQSGTQYSSTNRRPDRTESD